MGHRGQRAGRSDDRSIFVQLARRCASLAALCCCATDQLPPGTAPSLMAWSPPHTPQASTRTSTWPSPAVGTGRVVILKSPGVREYRGSQQQMAQQKQRQRQRQAERARSSEGQSTVGQQQHRGSTRVSVVFKYLHHACCASTLCCCMSADLLWPRRRPRASLRAAQRRLRAWQTWCNPWWKEKKKREISV
jgi:hypothetical protein